MKTALVISSFVAASHVGATASAFCLRRLGIQTHILPTTLLGRHPGWGVPGGGAVDATMLADMWDGVAAQNIAFDAVMTGYMANPEHTYLAARIIQAVRRKNPSAYILVDPVMGDNDRLYVDANIASAIGSELIPMADIITPNVWELGYLTKSKPQTLAAITEAAKSLSPDVLVTSVPVNHHIGALLQSGPDAGFVQHKKFEAVPHGGGDALAGTFLAHILHGASPGEALAKSTAAVFDMLSAAVQHDMGELPLIRRQDALISAPPLDIEKLPSKRPDRD